MSLLFETQIKSFEKNHVCYSEGDEVDFVYLVKEGEVELVQSQGKKHSRISIALLPENAYFGDQELLSKNERRTCMAYVKSASALLYVIKKNVNIILKF